MKRIALVLVLLALFTSHRSAAGCGPLPGNGDVTTLFWGVLDYSDATRECLPWKPCWPGQFARAKDVAARDSHNIPANLVYQAMVLHLGPEDQNALLDFYLNRAKAEPANPTAQYLAAQVAPHAAEQLALLGRAVKLDPSFGPAYLDLAHAVLHPHPNQNKKDLERDYGTVEANLARFMRECPQYPGAALQLNEVGDAALWKQNLPKPRRAIEAHEGPRGLWRYLDALADLWALEKRLYPQEAKGRLLADLAFLQHLGSHYAHVPLPILDALASARHRLSQFKEEEQVRDQILARFACTSVGANSALRIHGERYWIAHGGSRKSPLKLPVAEARVYYEEVRSQLRACPDHMAVALWNELPAILRLGLSGALTPQELARDERYYQTLWPKVEGVYQFFSLQAPGYVFPLIKLQGGQPLGAEDVSAIRSLIRYQRRWNDNRRANGWTDDELPEDQEVNKIGRAVVDVQLSSLLVRALVRVGRVAEARRVLGSVADEVASLTAQLHNKKAWGVRVALAKYWSATVDLAANPSDAYAYLRLASVLQPADHDSIDHDPSVDTALTQASKLVGSNVTPGTWQGSPASAEVLRAADALAQAAAKGEATQDVRWRYLAKPITLPAFALHDLAGRTFTLDDLKGRVALVNVWATWCGFCQLELPLLTKVAAEAAKDPRLLVVALNTDTDQTAVEPYLMKRPDIKLSPVLFGEEYFRGLAEDPIAKTDIRMAWPQTWLVKDGKVLALVPGFDGSVEPGTWIKDTLSVLTQAATKQ